MSEASVQRACVVAGENLTTERRLVKAKEVLTVDGRSLAVGCHARHMQFWTKAARDALSLTVRQFQPDDKGWPWNMFRRWGW